MRRTIVFLTALGCTDAGSIADAGGELPDGAPLAPDAGLPEDAPARSDGLEGTDGETADAIAFDQAPPPIDAHEYGPITVTVVVHGNGRVVSTPAGIDCTTACAAFFPRGEPVTLTATPIAGWLFDGFDEACTGTTPCVLSGNSDAVVQARFIGDGSDLWIRRIENASSGGIVRGVTVDASGAVTVSGYTIGFTNFGPGPQMAEGTFVARYGSTGVLDWLQQAPYGGVEGQPIAVDADGNVFAINLVGPLSKLSVDDGSTLWTAALPTNAVPVAVAVTPSGDAVVTGNYRMSINFGAGPRPGGYYGSVFVARYAAADGAFVWGTTLYESSYMAGGMGIAVDSGGNVAVTGYDQDTGSGTDFPDAFVARFLADDGALDWDLVLGGTSYDIGYSATVAAGDDVIVTGSFIGTVDFGGDPLSSATGGFGPSSDMFLARYTSTGAHVWSRAIGGYGPDAGRSLAMLSGDVVMVGGFFENGVRFGETSVSDRTSAGQRDAFVAAYGATGGYVTCATFGGTGIDEVLAVGSSPAGAAVGGTFDGTIDLAGVDYTSTGEQDLVVIATSNPPIDETDL